MSTVHDNLDRSPGRDVAADRGAVSGLIDLYMVTLDTLDTPAVSEQGDSWYRAMFTDDVDLSFPIGGHRGVSGLASFQRAAKDKFATTHHLSGNHLVQVDGERATLRAHVLATHVHLDSTLAERGAAAPAVFSVGGHYEAEAVVTGHGWRIREMKFEVDWMTGDGPPAGTDS